MKELGELVRGARMQKGISLDEAAAATRIRRQYLGAIEDGEFRIFPGPAYATGFLRNYSIFLGLNPDEILQTYHTLSPVSSSTISIAPATTVGLERLRSRGRRRTTWALVGAFVLVLLGVGVDKYATQSQGSGAQPPLSTPGLLSPHHTSKARISATSGLPPVGAHIPPKSGHLHSGKKSAQVGVKALQTAWISVKVDGHKVYWGPIYSGSYRHWSGSKIELGSHRGNAFRLHVDGHLVGRLSGRAGRVRGVATAQGWKRTS